NGNYLLAVFVADVASFVPRYSVFDRYAYEKSETIYIPHNVKTMLPEPFTEKLNLISKEDRPTIGHFIVLDEKMNILDFSVKKCLINVDKNYNYEEVVEEIKDDELLKNMYELSSKLHSKHEEKEIYRTIKNLKNVNLNDIGIGSSMIVEFMTLTNCLIAEYFDNHPEIPFIFRVNKGTYDKEVFNKIKELTNDKDKINDFRKMLDLVFSSSLYSTKNVGHKGLHLKSYCHSTNPIRNYASLECQRLIIEHIIENNKEINLEEERIYLTELCEYLNKRMEINKLYKNEYLTVRKNLSLESQKTKKR
ncbi:MAG: RNB domain-containing ribonuclease, partial [Bacilli bacterium]